MLIGKCYVTDFLVIVQKGVVEMRRHGFPSISASILHVVPPDFRASWYVMHLDFNLQRIVFGNYKFIPVQRLMLRF